MTRTRSGRPGRNILQDRAEPSPSFRMGTNERIMVSIIGTALSIRDQLADGGSHAEACARHRTMLKHSLRRGTPSLRHLNRDLAQLLRPLQPLERRARLG